MLAWPKQHKQALLLSICGAALGAAAACLYCLSEHANLEAKLVQAESELQTAGLLKKSLAAREVEVRILNNSKSALQALTEELQQQADEQARELEFYRRLMAAEKGKQGIDLNAWSVNQLAEQEYLIRLTFVQYAQQHRVVQASTQVYIEGQQEGQAQRYALEELLDAESKVNLALKFRYFQKVEGHIVLPEGFVAEKLLVEVKPAGRNAQSIRFDHLWQVQEL